MTQAIESILRRDPSSTRVVLEYNAKEMGLNTTVKSILDYYDWRNLYDEADKVCTSTLASLMNDPTIRSVFTIDSIFYLELIREWLGDMLSDVIKKVLVVDRIVSTENPSEIVVFESYDFRAPTIPIPLGKLVAPIARKHSIKVSVRSKTLDRLGFKVKKLLVPLYFLKKSVKAYNLVRLKSHFWSDLKKRSLDDVSIERKKVLFIPYSYAPRVSMEPIAERLCDFERISSIAVAFPSSDENAGLFENQWRKRRSRIPTYSFGEYTAKGTIQFTSIYRDLISLWKRRRNVFYASKTLMLNGVDLGQIVRERFELFYKYWIKDCVRYVTGAQEILRKEKPTAIIAAAQLMFMKSIFEVANRLGIPVVLIQHGIYCDSWLWAPLNVTKICTDEIFKEILIGRGEDPKKIIVTGAPRYDDLFGRMNEDRNDIKRRLRLDPQKKYMCLLTSHLVEWIKPESRRGILETLIESVRESNVDLIVKLHPQELRSEIRRLVNEVAKTKEAEERITIFTFEQADLFDVVLASDFVIGVRTSAIIPALLALKPSILINYDPLAADFFPGIEGEISGVARSNAELSIMVNELISNPSKTVDSLRRAEKYAKKYVPYQDSTDRVITCLLGLLEKSGQG